MSILDTNYSSKSIHLTRLEQIRGKNIPYSILQYSTLNEKFQLPNIQPPASGYPEIKYLAIGNKGATFTNGVNGIPIVNILTHSYTDSALFNQIPFVLVPVDNDLAPNVRANYRIRRLETYNGINYFAYYLKVLTPDVTAPEHTVITISNGVITAQDVYTPTPESLNPTPVTLSNTNVNTSDGRHLVTKETYPLTLTAADAANILEACNIIYGSPQYALITELGLVGGYDYAATSTDGNITASYTEIRTAQIMAFIGTVCYVETQDSSFGWDLSLSSDVPYPPTNVI